MYDSRRIIRQFLRRKTAVVGTVIVFIFVFTAAFSGLLTKHDPREQNLMETLTPPSAEHWFGTDEFGRDLFTRIVYGSRVSLAVGLIAVGIGVTVGVIVGSLAGYFGGAVDLVAMSVVDIVWSFPEMLLAIALVAVLQPGLTSAMVALGIVTWPQYARIIRAQFMSLKEKEFVESARSLGATDIRLIFLHILPNAIAPVIVIATMGMAGAILVEASLSYLGLGAQPPTPSWGSILSSGRNFIYRAPWMTFIPGAAIMLVVLGFNLCGDALRDILDPRQRSI